MILVRWTLGTQLVKGRPSSCDFYDFHTFSLQCLNNLILRSIVKGTLIQQ